MPGAYIPPHLRGKNLAAPTDDSAVPASPTPSRSVWTAEEIDRYYWPVNSKEYVDGEFKFSASDVGHRTLHDAASTPGRLAYIFLYPQANPKWDSDQIIYTKSCLNILPELSPDKTDGSREGVTLEAENEDPNLQESRTLNTANDANTAVNNANNPESHDSIAVYKIANKRCSGARNAEFEGWYRIVRIAYLQPHSDELIRMLEQKWTLTDGRGHEYMGERDSNKWRTSLAQQWAVIKFVKDEIAEQERGEPPVERVPTKSVNEMLAEMRQKESGNKEARET